MRHLVLPSGLLVGLVGVGATGAAMSAKPTNPARTHAAPSSALSSPYWVAGGKLIAFGTDDGKDAPSLWMMRADGSHRKKLAADTTYASLSPRGRLVADFPGDGSALVFRTPDRKRIKTIRVKFGAGGILVDVPPAWAPNERAIAFTVWTEGVSDDIVEVYVADLRTGVRSVSRTHRPEDSTPAWSPDGSRIAFVTCRGALDEPCKLMLMRPDGRGRTTLARNIGFAATPVWSPNGRMLALTQNFGPREVSNGGTKSRHGVYVIGRDGSGMRRIAATAMRPGPPSDPAWSRDGGRIVFSTDHGLFVYNLHRGTTRRISSMASGTLSWAPSRKILFSTRGAIYTVVPGSRPMKVAG